MTIIAKTLSPLRERLMLDTPAFHDGLQGFILSGSPQGGQVANVTARLTRFANSEESKNEFCDKPVPMKKTYP